MAIKVSALKRLEELGLPMDVEARNASGRCVAKGRILPDGRVLDLRSKREYASPTAFRTDVLYLTGPTYSRLYLNDVSLSSLGVGV